MLPHLVHRAPILARAPLATARPFATRLPLLQLSTRRLISSQPKLCAEEQQQKHSFQPHPADTIPRDLPSAAAPPAVRRIARAHEDWVLHHPVYTQEEVNSIKVVRQKRTTVTDKVASSLVASARWGFDFVTRYKHASPEEALAALNKDGKEGLPLEELIKQGYVMSEEQWMARILFLESIAGVPGMVAGMLRHLKSLRLMKRDGGWIHTLLEEAENERMHLLTFMKIRNPSKAFRLLVIATQGVFFNMFFLAYLISPRAAHRFVAYLEEEACVTYTQIADEIKRGNIPEWAPGATPVPQIAKDYWRLDDSATMLDLVLAVRADEASHRFVNHTLANLDGDVDWNPIGFKHPDAKMQGTMPGFTKEESVAWLKKVEDEMVQGREEVKKIES